MMTVKARNNLDSPIFVNVTLSFIFFRLFFNGLYLFNSSHPYIFFNQDRVTMTFVGFHIDQNGNLIDPDRRIIIEANLMSRHLRTGLFVQKVDMETNYESWSKYEIYIFT